MMEYCRRKALSVAETAWKKMNDCSLTGGKDLGKMPDIRFKKLKGVNGFAYPYHIEIDKVTTENVGRKILSHIRKIAFIFLPLPQKENCRLPIRSTAGGKKSLSEKK